MPQPELDCDIAQVGIGQKDNHIGYPFSPIPRFPYQVTISLVFGMVILLAYPDVSISGYHQLSFRTGYLFGRSQGFQIYWTHRNRVVLYITTLETRIIGSKTCSIFIEKKVHENSIISLTKNKYSSLNTVHSNISIKMIEETNFLLLKRLIMKSK